MFLPALVSEYSSNNVYRYVSQCGDLTLLILSCHVVDFFGNHEIIAQGKHVAVTSHL